VEVTMNSRVSTLCARAALVGIACASQPVMAWQFVPNCAVSGGACEVKLTPTLSGRTMTLVVDPDPAKPPLSNTPVTVTWTLSGNYKFFLQDGIVFRNVGGFFAAGYGADPNRPLPPPTNVYSALIPANAKVSSYYSITFHEVVLQDGNETAGRGWVCDPTIFNFDSPFTKNSPPKGEQRKKANEDPYSFSCNKL
jgi:hypothetical protein